MKVAVIGSGYVGLVLGACLAESGNDVVSADIDESKVTRLNEGEIPIYEPGLEPLIERNLADGRIRYTTDVAEAVRTSDIIFIAVGTPPGEDGSADLQHVLAVAKTIGRSMNGEKIVITKSTVPVGTANKVRAEIEAHTDFPVHVCSNPEFLKEGAAVEDFMKPDRVVLGVDSEYAGEVLGDLYAPFVRSGNEILLMDVPSAEITKYAANAMLATRISFMNAIAQLCEATGADINAVRKGVGSDDRIGHAFLYPGAGYGGSCLVAGESVLARWNGRARLLGLDALFREHAGGTVSAPGDPEPEVAWTDDLTVQSWSPEKGPEWQRASAVTRRWFEGEVMEVRTKMGRRVTCTPDHPFVVSEGLGGPPRVKLAEDLAQDDWLPVAMGQPAPYQEAPYQEAQEELELAGALSSLGFGQDEVIVRLSEEAHAALDPAAVRTAVMDHYRGWSRGYDSTGSDTHELADAESWYAVGKRLAEEHSQRLPDAVWDLSREDQMAVLSGLWQGDGSWSPVNGGLSVILEWGTVSRELADGVVRLLGGLDIGARLKVGRTALSTKDTYWVTVSGADSSLYRPDEGAAWVRVTGTRRIPFRGWVYSLEVPGNETFVTTAGLVVHNCFPKDVQALVRTMEDLGADAGILQAVEDVNHRQKRVLLDRLVARLGDDLTGKTVAVWGLAFKPNTDDMREAPSLVTIEGLLERGARVVVHDPVAMDEARHHLGGRVTYAESNYAALEGADALVIHTEWQPYRRPDFARMKAAMKTPLVFDGRNLWDPAGMAGRGFEYSCIGRGVVVAAGG